MSATVLFTRSAHLEPSALNETIIELEKNGEEAYYAKMMGNHRRKDQA